MINENTYVKDLSNRENQLNSFKVYSKNEGRCIWTALCLLFISIDQLEKQNYTLFVGSNSKHRATYS